MVRFPCPTCRVRPREQFRTLGSFHPLVLFQSLTLNRPLIGAAALGLFQLLGLLQSLTLNRPLSPLSGSIRRLLRSIEPLGLIRIQSLFCDLAWLYQNRSLKPYQLLGSVEPLGLF